MHVLNYGPGISESPHPSSSFTGNSFSFSASHNFQKFLDNLAAKLKKGGDVQIRTTKGIGEGH
jgi:hypothetical protein